MPTRLSFDIIPPFCGTNNTDQYECQVRENGFLVDWEKFSTDTEAAKWGREHKGELSMGAGMLYNEVIKQKRFSHA